MMSHEVVRQQRHLASRDLRSKCRSRGFTLVELLVVVGIVALLMAAIFAAVTKVRSTGKRTQCLANLKTIGAAIQQYLVDNNDTFPEAASGKGPTQPGDFLYWQSTPILNGPGTQFAIDLVGSRGVGKYISALDDLSPGGLQALRCPADERLEGYGFFATSPQQTAAHMPYKDPISGIYPYPFSYVISAFMVSGNYPDNEPDLTTIARTMSKVKDASSKIMVYEEDARTINDGVGSLEAVTCTTWTGYPAPVTELLSCRHDIHEAPSTIPPSGEAITVNFGGSSGTPPEPRFITMNHLDSYGNVLFADGHGEFVSRRFAHSKAHYAPDPNAPALAAVP
jgi:prepilin-type N-terminal cleavage/methylation domain-containing protein/prepilin-type processing-associated H-X9-DG protein